MNFSNIFLLFYNYLTLKKGGVLHLKKFESPSPKNVLCKVWLKLAKWFLRRFLNFIHVFLIFPYYLPLEKGVALHLNKFEFPSPKDVLSQIWLKLGSVEEDF